MNLLTADLRYALRANAIVSRCAQQRGKAHDPVPVVKFFNPLGSGAWLATELHDDNDSLFGLADLGSAAPKWASSLSMRSAASACPTVCG